MVRFRPTNGSWFLSTKDAETILISDGFRDADPRTMRAWGYFFHLATQGEELQLSDAFARRGSVLEIPSESEEDPEAAEKKEKKLDGNFRRGGGPPKKKSSKKKNSKKNSSTKNSSDKGSCKQNSKEGRKSTRSSPLQVPWSSFELLHELSTGRSGTVAVARYQDNLVAVKMFDIGKDGVNRFQQELKTYRMAQELQGKAIPTLMFISESPSGNVVVLGLELGAELPSDFDAWTILQRQEAFDALSKLAEISVAQNDIKPENFVVNSNGHLAVVDLEDTSILSTPKQTKAYLTKLKKQLHILSPLASTSQTC